LESCKIDFGHRLGFRGFDDGGQALESRVVQEKPESGLSNFALRDMIVAIHAASQRFLGVVEMKRLEAL
jgi:hypothetical protein